MVTDDIADAMISALQMIYASRMMGTDIISYLQRKYIIRQRRISYCVSDISLKTFSIYDIISSKKLEYVGVNDENFIYDWWHYGSWKNNCVPTTQTRFTE